MGAYRHSTGNQGEDAKGSPKIAEGTPKESRMARVCKKRSARPFNGTQGQPKDTKRNQSWPQGDQKAPKRGQRRKVYLHRFKINRLSGCYVTTTLLNKEFGCEWRGLGDYKEMMRMSGGALLHQSVKSVTPLGVYKLSPRCDFLGNF